MTTMLESALGQQKEESVNALTMNGVSRNYGSTVALADVSVSLEPDKIYGLLGRNGAGKSTFMALATAQAVPSSGAVAVFGNNPFENPWALQRMCFLRDDQKYPERATPKSVIKSASWLFSNWDEELADRMVKQFSIPLTTRVKKLSRGQRSALAVTVGLASRSPITFFDEPYLGLDAIAREDFYNLLVEDFSEHPRTIILSSHLIDEIADIINHVIILDKGRIIVDSSVEDLASQALFIEGPSTLVGALTDGERVLSSQNMGGTSRTMVLSDRVEEVAANAFAQGLKTSPVGLQQLANAISRDHTFQVDRPELELGGRKAS